MNPIRLIIAGSRHLTIPIEFINSFVKSRIKNPIVEVVCGEASGIDACGKLWAEKNNIPVKSFPANWEKHGKSAGPIRNAEMAEYGQVLLLIWDGISKGSTNMSVEMREKKKPIHEIIIKEWK